MSDYLDIPKYAGRDPVLVEVMLANGNAVKARVYSDGVVFLLSGYDMGDDELADVVEQARKSAIEKWENQNG